MRHLGTGKDTQFSMLPNSGRLGLSLSSDHRYLIYSQLDHQGSDLMLVPNFR